MIDPRKISTGDFVTAIAGFHDYAKEGDVFRIIDSRIPGEETTAVGWAVDMKTGLINSTVAYKLPHDKISMTSRSKVAATLSLGLAKIEKEMQSIKRKRDVLKDRIEGLLRYDNKEDEVKDFIYRTFDWVR